MDERMTIGEFARRSGLSAKVLRTYDEQGVLVPCAVETGTGYRYYDARQLTDATTVVLLRRAGVSLADIGAFLVNPTSDAVEGWESSLVAEVQLRRQALAEVRGRLGLRAAPTRGAVMVDIRPVEDRDELRQVFDLLGGQFPEPIDTSDFRFADLDARFPADRALMVVASAEGRPIGGALAFRNDDNRATLRMIAVVEAFRHRGVGRRLVESIETAARLLGVDTMGLGTSDHEIGFYVHLGYAPRLLFQWVFDTGRFEEESEAVLAGPLAGMRYWRSSFNDVPQLYVELDEPRLDLCNAARDLVSGAHVGFMTSKKLVPR